MLEQAPTGNAPGARKPDGKSRRGFASMGKERHKLVSSKGGKSSRNLKPGPEPERTNRPPLG